MPYLNSILSSQYQASLRMLHNCIKACPAKHWEDKIVSATIRQITYHTLFCTDMYLSPNADAFKLRPLHRRGGDERGDTWSRGLSKPQTLAYLAICRRKAIKTLASESPKTLQGPSGFRKCSRGEFHLYNIRHIQHHTGQLSAHLRRMDPALTDSKLLPWVGSGWK